MSLDLTISPIDRAIAGIDPLAARHKLPPAGGAEQEGGGASFADILRGQIDQVVNLQNEAEVLQQQLAAGQIEDVNRVVLAVQKADLALNFALQLRNKVLEAYQEIARTQV